MKRMPSRSEAIRLDCSTQ